MGVTVSVTPTPKSVVVTTTTTTSTINGAATSRFKRERCKRTEHDSEFSDWKILVGPSDWENYSQNKDNAPKYKTQNVPSCSACSGVYELGVSLPQSGRRGRNLSSERIIPVYVGQADNVRNRLQQYGREGAHLEKGCQSLVLNDSKPLGLFTGIFSKGFPIVYRWAPMKSKSDAEKAEAQLLDTFDYAWNKEKNGARRPNDIHQILDRYSSRPTKKLLTIVSKLQIIPPKKVGVKIRNCEPVMLDDRSSFYVKHESSRGILSRIFKLGRSRPIVVSKELGLQKDHTSICGVALGQGSVCTMNPVEGRKRCVDHKGMKVNGSTTKSSPNQSGLEGLAQTCGVSLGDGSICTREPVARRKRCDEHYGRSISGQSSTRVIAEKKYFVHDPALKSRDPCDSEFETKTDTISGADLKNMVFCMKPPVLGHESFEKHEEMKLTEQKSKVGGISVTLTCGATTLSGSLCKRKPGEGGKWCWQHEPKKVDTFSSSQPIACRKYGNEGGYFYSSSCAAMTKKGSRCSRQATADREMCWQHLGVA